MKAEVLGHLNMTSPSATKLQRHCWCSLPRTSAAISVFIIIITHCFSAVHYSTSRSWFQMLHSHNQFVLVFQILLFQVKFRYSHQLYSFHLSHRLLYVFSHCEADAVVSLQFLVGKSRAEYTLSQREVWPRFNIKWPILFRGYRFLNKAVPLFPSMT